MARTWIDGTSAAAIELRSLIAADPHLSEGARRLFSRFRVGIVECSAGETVTVDLGLRASRLELRVVRHLGPLLPDHACLVRAEAGMVDDDHIIVHVPPGDAVAWAVSHALYRALLDERNGEPL